MSGVNVLGNRLRYKNLLLVIKQTAFEEYSQLKLRGQGPKALRWKRLEQRYSAHKKCVTDLLSILQRHDVSVSCVNRAELDRQHLADIDLLIAVGGDGTVLSAAHFLDHGTIALLGINSDPNITKEDLKVQKQVDERRSHGALCMYTAMDMEDGISNVLYGGGHLASRARIRCKIKSTFSETRLVPALNDLLISNPSPAGVSRYRMGWLAEAQTKGGRNDLITNDSSETKSEHFHQYGTMTRFGGVSYDVINSLNVWSSGMWISTATGSSAAMSAAGGKYMPKDSTGLQYLIREHMTNNCNEVLKPDINNRIFENDEKMHLRWNSRTGRIFIDGSHLSHNLELGDEILIDNEAPPLKLFTEDASL